MVVDDRMVVAAIQRGDPRGLASAYDVYADRLYAFCASMLRDPDAAADALHDTYVIANQRIGQLRDPDRLRPWLYAIARNECLRQLRARRRVTVLDEAGDVRDESVNLDRDLREAELRTLVWQAAEGLNPKERAALELSLRHGLEGRDLADALGVSVGHMNTLLTRARQQLERSLSAILVARTGRSECAELAEIVAGWDGQLTVLMRKRISRHIDNCATCSARKRTEVSATALLGAIPLIAAPFGLRRKILDDIDDMDLVGYRERIADRAGRFNREGFPVSHDSRPRPAGMWQWGAAAVFLGVAIILGALLWQDQQGDKASTANAAPALPLPSPTPTLDPTTLPPSPSPAPSPSPTASPSQPASTIGTPTANPARPSPRPTSRPPTRPPVTTPTTRPSTKPTPGTLVVAPDKLDFGRVDTQLGVTLTATGGQVAEWSASTSVVREVPPPPGIDIIIVKPASGGPLVPGARPLPVTIALNRGNAVEFGVEAGQVKFDFPGGSVVVNVTWQNPSEG